MSYTEGMKVVFLDEATISLNGDMDMGPLEAVGELVCYPRSSPQQIEERCAAAEAVIVNKVKIDAAFFEKCPSVRYVAVIATGYNNVDLAAARAHGVDVSNVFGYGRFAVPQHAFALLLNLAGQVLRYARDVEAGEWAAQDSFTLLRYPTVELAGKTLGIVGFGAIGRGSARIAEGFGMNVLPHDAYGFEEPPYKNHHLEELLEASDAISVHCPLTDQTRSLFNAAAFRRMKKTAFLVNTARGGIVNEDDLLWALTAGEIAGAALDVMEEEPPRASALLSAGLPNLIATPHAAWSAREARQRLINETARNLEAFAAGARRNVVNADQGA